ncbi:glycosyltransferase [Corynebacterium pyruviciproducens]|uniref:glycosyltransferase n=1 Tax=Corynebacterium pyruviciproducens TaxID=598660 RepID=UPI00254ED030|nr:glycosyltransferase [Corynebacterium pyruviciproducens]MDK6565944.1 glycosyltransferase [Corynebacterium pyruviciproducens]
MLVGTTRFSVFQPNSTAWKATASGEFSEAEALVRYLYSPERIEPRLDIFLNYSLPLLKEAASKVSLKHVVMFSEEMPEKYKRQLQEAAEENEFLVLNCHKNGHPDPHISGPHMLAKAEIGSDGVYGLYRLDDDDLLGLNFFTQAEKYLQPAFAGMRVSFAKGYTGFYNSGQFSEVRECYNPLIAIGLLSVCERIGDKKIIQPPDVSHIFSDRFGPVILDSREPSYFWSRHITQDTSFGDDGTDFQRIKQQVRANPRPEDEQLLMENFPSLQNNIFTPNFKRVGGDFVASGNGTVLPANNDAADIEVRTEITCQDGNPVRGGLIAFSFVDSEGKSADPSDVVIDGLTLSPNRSIGWYRYLVTTPGSNTQNISFSIESSHLLSEVQIRPFGSGAKSFRVNKVEIASK